MPDLTCPSAPFSTYDGISFVNFRLMYFDDISEQSLWLTLWLLCHKKINELHYYYYYRHHRRRRRYYNCILHTKYIDVQCTVSPPPTPRFLLAYQILQSTEGIQQLTTGNCFFFLQIHIFILERLIKYGCPCRSAARSSKSFNLTNKGTHRVELNTRSISSHRLIKTGSITVNVSVAITTVFTVYSKFFNEWTIKTVRRSRIREKCAC